MILCPLPMFRRLIRHADHSFETWDDGVPDPRKTIPGRVVIQAHADSLHTWSVWSIEHDRRTGRFARLRDWLAPLDPPSWTYDLAAEAPQFKGGERLFDPRHLNALTARGINCRLAFVGNYGDPLRLGGADWLLPVSWHKGPDMSRVFYVDRSKPPEAMFAPGFDPNTSRCKRAVLRYLDFDANKVEHREKLRLAVVELC